ncbi:MAG: ROK family protein, partial [Nitriliruptoraceae bacterium]
MSAISDRGSVPALGIDIGGSRLRAAVVGPDGRIAERNSRPTPAAEAAAVLERLGELIADHPGLPVGVGIAGLVDPDGTVRYGPNIGVRDLPLAAELARSSGAEVSVANDASVAALAEQRVGAAQGVGDVVLLTVGTGVGGGIVSNGSLLLGAGGFAGEIGHLIVEEGGRRCPCGNRGCIEAYASGTAIGLLARERLVDPEIDTVLRGHEAPTGVDVSSAAADGDRFAVSVLEEAGGWLGVALASLVNVLDPAIVLLGGGAAQSIAPYALPAARRAMTERLVGSAWRAPPPVEVAVLGDDAGVVGAALLDIIDPDGMDAL